MPKYRRNDKPPGRALAGGWRGAVAWAPAATAMLSMAKGRNKKQIWNRREFSLSSLQRTEERRNKTSDGGAREGESWWELT